MWQEIEWPVDNDFTLDVVPLLKDQTHRHKGTWVDMHYHCGHWYIKVEEPAIPGVRARAIWSGPWPCGQVLPARSGWGNVKKATGSTYLCAHCGGPWNK